MKSWLEEGLLNSHQSMNEDSLGYYLGRGIPSWMVAALKMGVFIPPDTQAPDKDFVNKQGYHGEEVSGWFSIPVWTPSGKILGVEFRNPPVSEKKKVRKFFLPEANWTASFMGMCPEVMQKIADGADIWLTEGIFDLCIAHVIPSKDVALGCGGAKISAPQKDFLKRFLRKGSVVKIVFDEDQTGREHSEGYVDPQTGRYILGVLEKLERERIPVVSIRYQGGSDPGEIWDSGGRVALRESFNL